MPKTPRWFIRNMCYPSGARLDKLEVWQKPVVIQSMGNQSHTMSAYVPTSLAPKECAVSWCRAQLPPGRYLNDLWLCLTCAANLDKGKVLSPTPASRSYEGGYTPSAEALRTMKDGSLGNEEFRFWIPVPQIIGSCTMRGYQCRACQDIVASRESRQDHKEKFDPKCTQVLVEAYAILKKKGFCVSCKSHTSKSAWGVPLCGPTCESQWKYSTGRFFLVAWAVKEVRKKYQAIRADATTASALINAVKQLQNGGSTSSPIGH